MEETTTKNLIRALIITAVIIFVGIIIPLTLGLGTESLAEEGVGDIIEFYQKFYWSLTVIWAVMIAFIFIKKNNQYGDGIGFAEIGQKPAMSFFKRFTGLQLTILSIIFFTIIFTVANYMKFGAFTSLRTLPTMQFTKAQSLLFSTLVIPAPENLLLGAIIALTLLVGTILAIKYKPSYSEYIVYLYIAIFIIGGIFGWVWHNSAYPDSDISKLIIFFFWGIGAIISIATGLWLVFWIMHTENNFFIDFSRLYSSDILLTFVVVFVIGMCFIYWWLYRGRLFGQFKSKEILR
jgi:hypothetical protein